MVIRTIPINNTHIITQVVAIQFIPRMHIRQCYLEQPNAVTYNDL